MTHTEKHNLVAALHSNLLRQLYVQKWISFSFLQWISLCRWWIWWKWNLYDLFWLFVNQNIQQMEPGKGKMLEKAVKCLPHQSLQSYTLMPVVPEYSRLHRNGFHTDSTSQNRGSFSKYDMRCCIILFIQTNLRFTKYNIKK